MSNSDLMSESREVSDFDRVVVRAYGELHITQGDHESLTVEADKETLPRIKTQVKDGALVITMGGSWGDKVRDAVTSSLARRPIRYTLVVKTLAGLEITGAARVKASHIQADRLQMHLGGAGDVNVESLNAEGLEVDITGAGRIHAAGQVIEQRISIGGAGTYNAPRLQSDRARVSLRGAGKATVWAIEELAVAITGLGNVEYYGTPTVEKNVSGFGTVKGLGNP